MNGKYMVFLILMMLTSWLTSEAYADRRSYVWTYEYLTMERGEAELESYFTLSTPDMGDMEGNTVTDLQFELEVGMSDRFDFAIYQVFSQYPEESLKYKGYKLRARYRFGEQGQYVLDPLAYVEYKGKPDFSEHGIELKIILAKDIGRFNMALNPILELELNGETEVEAEYAIGLNYEILSLLSAGLEFKGSESGHYVGPTIGHGVEQLWMTMGAAFPITDIDEGKPEFQIRLLVGIGLI